MASPVIALRFRDTTVGIDTIEAHRALLESNGSVGWGWWKKAFEPDQAQAIRELLAVSGQILVALIDRTRERNFLCECVGFSEPRETPAETVPEYYRRHINDVAGIFVLRSMEEVEFDRELAAAIGDQTFLWAGRRANAMPSHVAEPAQAPGRSCVLHLSDLHFGADYGFRRQGEDLPIGDNRRTLAECLLFDLERVGAIHDIAAVIVTGDFMTQGRFNDEARRAALAEFEELRAGLRLGREQIVAVPGNHDVVRYAPDAVVDVRDRAIETQTRYEHETHFRTFVSELVGRDWREALNYVRRIHLSDADLDVCVLNSCTIAATEWTEYGYVGRSGLDTIAELQRYRAERPTFRFLALHHHLLPVAGVEAPQSRGVTLTLDAADILAAAQRSGVHVALHGHQHKPKIALYQNFGLNGEPTRDGLYVVANGSAGVRTARLPHGERNTYCLFRLGANSMDLCIRELRLDGAAGAETFRGVLAARPVAA